MTAPEKAVGLMERYVREVGRNLPARQRADVEEELRSLLREKLEEHAAARGRMDEEAAVEVLREFGKPETVAERYLPPAGHLIGPQLFPAYVVTAKFVAAGLAIFLLLWHVVGLASVSVRADLPSFLRPGGWLGLLAEYVRLALVNLGVLTLVFAVIERVQARTAAVGAAAASRPEEWNPRELPEIADPDRISVADRVWRAYCIVAFFVLLNFYPQYFGLLFLTGEGVRGMSVFELGLRVPVPLLNLWFALALALNVCLIREGRWTRQWRWVEFGIGVFGGLILYLTLAASTLGLENASWRSPFQWAFQWMDLREMFLVLSKRLPFLGRVLIMILSFCLLGTIIESALRLYRLLRASPAPPPQPMADAS